MPIRPLIPFPDPRLRRPAEPVAAFDAALAELARDLVDTLVAVGAIGLTAPHLGIGQRVTAIRMGKGEGEGEGVRVYVNPVCLWASPETARHEEGSVSMPGAREHVVRPARIQVRYRDLAGEEHMEAAEGFAAAVLLHEIDQLDGIFWTERLSRLKRDRLVRRYEKTRPGGPGPA